jgi:two-component system response regulator FixJ
MTVEATVFIIDDDEAVRDGLKWLIESVDLKAAAFTSAQEFLDRYTPGQPGCLLLDIRMPGMSGLALQQVLKSRSFDLPIIILTGHGTVQMAVDAMKAGAFDFIEKPFQNQRLLDRIHDAIDLSINNNIEHEKRAEVMQLLELLTPREHQVLNMVVAGETNKAIAYRLDISEKTVEVHRAKVMEKLGAASLADLIRKTRLVAHR